MKNVLKFLGVLSTVALMSFNNPNKKIVVIDAGHGGKDNGAVVASSKEKEVSLAIAKKVKELNKNTEIEIILTREQDEFLSLKDRANFINNLKPDFVLSIHTNSNFSTELNGVELYVSDKNENITSSEKFATDLQSNFAKQNAVIKKADFYLLKEVKAPINFIEIGVISNENDRNYMTSDTGQEEIAQAILNAIE